MAFVRVVTVVLASFWPHPEQLSEWGFQLSNSMQSKDISSECSCHVVAMWSVSIRKKRRMTEKVPPALASRVGESGMSLPASELTEQLSELGQCNVNSRPSISRLMQLIEQCSKV